MVLKLTLDQLKEARSIVVDSIKHHESEILNDKKKLKMLDKEINKKLWILPIIKKIRRFINTRFPFLKIQPLESEDISDDQIIIAAIDYNRQQFRWDIHGEEIASRQETMANEIVQEFVDDEYEGEYIVPSSNVLITFYFKRKSTT